ncbi:hypothetical protein [Streptomyces sp. NPDC048106]|uniref:hypothetical protein n=1 Tax=Streptomyces sp. NPDC048106 TaxID=3155750 RepID=UPI003456CDBC
MTADLSPIRSSFAAVRPHGSQVTEYFHDHLSAHRPGVRPLFAALAHFAGDAWTLAAGESWTAVQDVISGTVIAAAEAAPS